MKLWATLKEWSRRPPSLDSRECDLIGLLRSDNPRFQQATLKALRNLRYCSDRLIAEIIRIIEDDDVMYETRVLAVEALSHIISLDRPSRGSHRTRQVERAAMLRRLLDKSLPVDVTEALNRALATAQGDRAASAVHTA